MNSIETEKVDPSDGFVVCLQTAWSNIYNIGITKKTPAEFLQDENNSHIFPPPKPYVIIYSKRIEDPEEKSQIFYELIHKYDMFSHKERKFYKIPDPLSIITEIVTDMNFKSWTNTCKQEEERTYCFSQLTPFMFKGKTYQRNYYGHTWTKDWNTKKWVGIYNYKTKILDSYAPECVIKEDCDSD
jgi:hypothetical protein